MRAFVTRRHIMELVGGFLAIALVVAGVWFFVQRAGQDGTTQPPAGQPPAGQPSANPSPTGAPVTSPATMTVKVYFHKGPGADPAKLSAVERTVPNSPMVATAALTQLLAGPTSAERDAGYWSVFSSRTAGMLLSVRIGNGVGHADFRDLSKVIPNASSSTGSAVLLSELDATLKQFGTVDTTVYSFSGKVAPFYEWLQMSPPVGMRPGLAQARVVARDFLVRVVGMANPSYVRSSYVSDYLARVEFRPTIAGKATGSVTSVLLGYGVTGFRPIWVTTDTIVVDTPPLVITPSEIARVTSPLTVTGRALAWEGRVTLRVVQDNGLAVRRLGEGYGTGGGDQMRPFSAQVPFSRPGTSTGWLVAAELSARNGEVTKATVAPLVFAGAPVRPGLLRVTYATNPTLPEFQSDDPMAGIPVNGWAMPTGQGTVTFTMSANAGTDRVQLFLTPLGAGATPTPTLLGTAARSGTTFTYAWHYADEPLLAKVTIVATGPAGRNEQVAFNVFHR
ncbi:MAG TPA: Gmad2 immunoglobulin-like domain-containing protein [Micromonosporaceae bacterium]|nr:Gmad2 immunoglobulin-like domain-containing protein [Micromonosporaceae bacterium]